jgi:ABC-type sugar transport system ATPase subunit
VSDVTLEDVRVERDGRLVLDIGALTLRSRRTTAILGPNGSGKTTLLRVIAGLDKLRTGRIALAGAPVVHRRELAYVFQEDVFLRQTVRRNLEIGLELRGVAPNERRRRIDEAATVVGIAHMLERRADRLSGGEGRRVSLARAMCLRTPVVLLDEPLAGLDESGYARLLDELPRIVDAFQATTVLVTHSRDEALRLAHDLVVLVDGRVQAAGEAHAIAASPGTAMVAEVLGYTVIDTSSGAIAVPSGAFRVGGGQPEFSMIVDRVVEMVGFLEITGRIGHVRVSASCTSAASRPKPGEHVTIHAARYCDVQEQRVIYGPP